MRRPTLFATALVLSVTALGFSESASAQYPPGTRVESGARYGGPARPDVEVGFFYRDLSPYGDWIYTYDYGWAWMPRNARAGWRPYLYGQWVWSEYGWFWVSHEPFGWATFHYGRWDWHPRLGWIWIPGRTWGPAWVTWQHGQGWVGWAPLPPEVGFEIGIGLRLGGFDLRVGLRPDAYTFVEERRFLDRDPYRYAAPTARNVTIIHNTVNITNVTVVNQRVVNRGVDPQRFERVTGHKVRALRVSDASSEGVSRVRGDEIVVYRPPKSRLDTVRVDERKFRRERGESEAKGREFEVAPRVQSKPPVSDHRIEREERQERERLEAYERSERQRLERVQREELAREKATAQRNQEIRERHEQERRAFEDQAKRRREQLEARQQVERRAEKAAPQRGADRKDDDTSKSKGKAKPKDKPEAPPPAH